MTDKPIHEYYPFNVNKDYCHINGDYIMPYCKKENYKFLKWYKSVEDRLWRLEGDDKQIIIKELSYLVNLGDAENEIYDNLQALLEVLRVQETISNEAYEQAEIKVSKIWGDLILMSKEIIVNDVDVSGCEKQGETVAGITCGNGERIRLANEIITKHTLCKDNPNCIYKQLKRKEQECEKWKSYYELYQINNDSLKKVHAVINDNPKYGIELTENGILDKDERLSYLEVPKQIKLILDEQAKEIDLLNAENERLKQSLIEIETIAGEAKTACESCSERYTDCTDYKDFENEGDCTHCGIGARASLAKQVLQKVSEREVKMPNEIEKQFFDTFGIECNISYHQQFNCAQIPRGLEVYKEREKLEKEGIIKIWHRMLTPRPANDCIYWGEYHYPEITDHILLELICIAHTSPVITFVSRDVKSLKEEVLMVLCNWVSSRNIKQQVQEIFKGGNNND